MKSAAIVAVVFLALGIFAEVAQAGPLRRAGRGLKTGAGKVLKVVSRPFGRRC